MRQKQKNLLSLTVLTAIAALVVAYAYFGVMKTTEEEAVKKDANERLFNTGRDDEGTGPVGQNLVVERITVENRSGKTILERRDGKWWITSPVVTPADAVVADNLSSQLQSAKFKQIIEEKPTTEDLARYGLDAPTFTLTAEASLADPDGGGSDDPARRRTVSIKGGIENLFDGSIYMQRNDEPTVWSAEGGIRWNFDKSLFDLRAKDLLAVEEVKIETLGVANAKGKFELARDAGGKGWKFTRPTQETSDTATVAAMLGALRSTRATAFLEDSAETRKKLGLETPQLDLAITLESGPPVRIRVTRTEVDGVEKVIALREDGKDATLAEVTDAVLSGFDRTSADLRDRSVLAFDRDAVSALSFTPVDGGAPVVLERTRTADAGVAEEWEVVAPRKGPARKWKVSSVLWSLGALKASDIGEEKPKSWEALGVDASSRTITLKNAAGKTLAELRIGNEPTDKPGLLAVRGTRDQVLYVDQNRLNELPAKLGDMLEGEP